MPADAESPKKPLPHVRPGTGVSRPPATVC
ncbi:hypothetical protein SAMN05216533_8006 [Streptomyces sp. Ag109_O5-10]|nr:hypothetical protein SAMN05216533_8006 [Streptomyces sp. Ag109_O5-10]